MTTVSLCMCVKNDEAVIERCLKSVADLVDEIIVVDLNSTDRTRELVSLFTNHIYSFDIDNNETEALHYSFQLATKQYILWLHPSDILFEHDRIKFIQLKQSINSKINGISMNYFTKLNAKNEINKIRLVRRDSSYSFSGEPSDSLIVSGNKLDANLTINHLPYTNNTKNNIKTFESMIEENIDFSPRDLFYYAKELSDDEQHDKAIKYFLKFLRTKQHFNEHNILACNYLADNYHHLHLNELEKSWLLQSFQFEKPQPETCCRIGYYFLDNNNYDAAIFWYKEAVSIQHSEQFASSHQPHSTWLPHLQLAVCYDRIGEYQLANDHNELAFNYHPTHASILSNRQYFSNLLKK